MKRRRDDSISRRDGYRVALVDDSILKVLNELVCPICFEVLVEPMQTPCLHVFCKKCLEDALAIKPSCPKDRAELRTEELRMFQDANPAAYRMLFGSLQVWCPLYHGKGCDWKGDYTSMRSHLESSCPMHPQPCEYCHEDFPRESLGTHKSTCAARPVKCEYCSETRPLDKIKEHHSTDCQNVPVKCKIHPIGDEPRGESKDGKEEADRESESVRAGCFGTFPRSALAAHQKNDCPKSWMVCSLSAHGCKSRFQREKLAEHMTKSATEHVDLLARVNSQQKSDFDQALREEAKQRLAMEARLDILTTRWGEFARSASTGGSTIDVKQAGLTLGGSTGGGGPKLYVMGGYSGSTCLRTADYFDVNEQRWVSVPSLPRPRAFGGAAALGGRAFLFGGLETAYVSSAWCFNPSSNTWSIIAPMNQARVMCAGVTCGGRIYALGGEGTDNKAVGTCEVYDPVSNQWSVIAPMITPRTHMAATSVGGKIYVFGGRSTGSNMDVLAPCAECYDPVTGRWRPVATPLTRRSGGSAVVLDGKILICGGDTVTSENQSVMVGSIEQYDPVSDAWSTCSWSLSTPRSQIAAHVVLAPVSSSSSSSSNPMSLYVLGGWEGKDVATAEVLNFTTSSWTPIASLPSVNRGFATVMMS